MNKLVVNKLLIVSISLVYLLVLLLPYNQFYYTRDEGSQSEEWRSGYIFNDDLLLYSFLPFGFVWLLCLTIQNKKVHLILRFSLLCLTLVYFYLGVSGITMLAQDFLPHFGIYLSCLLLPLVVCYLINRKSIRLH
jgi:hypothetical protein